MDPPIPPDDDTLKNIIDKLANFVARNGPDFETMTREKQKNNPKFAFLNGGQYHDYYAYILHNEKYNNQNQPVQQQQSLMAIQNQAMLINQSQRMVAMTQQMVSLPPQQQQSSQPPTQAQSPIVTPNQIINVQQLSQTAIPIQNSINPMNDMALQQICIQRQDAIDQMKTSEHNLAAQFSSLQQQKQVNIEQSINAAQDAKLHQMAFDCNLVLSNFDAILLPVIENCSKDSISNGKNYILTNSLNCDQAQTIAFYLQSRIVNPYASFDTRLHLIYLINDILHHCMRRGVEDMRLELENVVVSIFSITHSEITADKQIKLLKLLNLWDKNKYFSDEIIEQLRDAGTAAKAYKTRVLNEHSHLISEANITTTNHYQSMERQHLEFANHLSANIAIFDQKIAAMKMEAHLMQDANPISHQNQTFNSYPVLLNENINSQNPNISSNQNGSQKQNQLFDYNHALPPLGDNLPDLSQPPPGYNQNVEMDLKPKLPYHALPAALMVPLVELDERYVPIDADCIRLPAPTAPSERVLQAVETFYNPPSRETPRDEDGWETLGLFEFHKMKNENVKNQRRLNGLDSDSNSDDDVKFNSSRDKEFSPSVITRYSSLSPDRMSSEGYDSRSPRYNNESSSDSESYVGRDRSDSRSPCNVDEEPYSNASYEQIPDEMLGGENKGHQLLKKMGWDGKGLGQDGRGIIDPVKSSDVRNRDEKYVGIGKDENRDEYESFRKNRATDYNFKRTGNRRR